LVVVAIVVVLVVAIVDVIVIIAVTVVTAIVTLILFLAAAMKVSNDFAPATDQGFLGTLHCVLLWLWLWPWLLLLLFGSGGCFSFSHFFGLLPVFFQKVLDFVADVFAAAAAVVIVLVAIVVCSIVLISGSRILHRRGSGR